MFDILIGLVFFVVVILPIGCGVIIWALRAPRSFCAALAAALVGGWFLLGAL